MPQTIGDLVYLLFIGGTALTFWLFKRQQSRNEKDIVALMEKHEINASEITKVKMNYLDRFAKLDKTISSGNTEIMREINNLRIEMVKNFATKEDLKNL